MTASTTSSRCAIAAVVAILLAVVPILSIANSVPPSARARGDVVAEPLSSAPLDEHPKATGTLRHFYDERDRIIRTIDGRGHELNYTYDPAGNLLTRRSPTALHSYEYDAVNRMTSVTARIDGEPARKTTYAYDPVGNRLTMTSADGVVTHYGYDRINRLTSLTKRTAAGALIFSAVYSLEASGLRVGIDESDSTGHLRSVSYTYDGMKRLTREAIVHRNASNGRTTSWTYDRVGNRLTQTITPQGGTAASSTYTYDANDRLEKETINGATTRYAYDANGNTIGKANAGLPIAYTYDDANRLVRMTQGTESVSYTYNVDGLRTTETRATPTGATRTEYLVDSNHAYAQVAEEWKSNDGTATRPAAVFSYGHEIVGQSRCTTPTASGCGGAQTSINHADGFGSTRLLTDSAGVITDTFEYDAFGNDIGRTGTTPTEHLYRGEQLDPNLGFYYLRARYLNPAVGRFLTADGFGGLSDVPASANRFVYAAANPIQYLDPSGFIFTSAFGYAVEERVEFNYSEQHIGEDVEFGLLWFGLKPDIQNRTRLKFMEIKPLSVSGIAKGIAQITSYTIKYLPRGMLPGAWQPPGPLTVAGRTVWFKNLFGVIFYTDEGALAADLALIGSFEDARRLARRARDLNTAVGVDAQGAAVRNLAVVALVGAASVGTLVLAARIAYVSLLPL